ncbi:G-protein coupled receptors family 1 profile domain-containing protein [Caenorhabditis elegans]|uniref:G-protein coupled receptors family 1 profile domain-containing protein n=1 Tax=Caenorhabditis elegans TaxID=6239 RepID=O16341_CAEEL|nr:G-protein coupled receptors family 1 profile domain-containing protein [Caenorhabditis elegans]CCD67832.2 G-protein coupled receptors family 1 profile domain-containing protein [Caenorhabditis elegans]|eukprot:NP_503828.3 Serpentine Receptor, class W [Caenorhabditis elegans]
MKTNNKATTVSYYHDEAYTDEDPEHDIFDYDYDIKHDYFDVARRVYTGLCTFGFLINLVHMVILTRKELRTNLVYIVMIGICICELTQSFTTILSYFMTLGIVYRIENVCGLAYFHVMIDVLATTFQYLSRRCASILGLFLVVFRTCSIIFPMSSAIDFVMRPKIGCLLVLTVTIMSSAYSFLYFSRAKIVKERECYLHERSTYVLYTHENSNKEMQFQLMDGYIAMVVCFLYIIVAGTLIFQLQKAKQRRKNLKAEKSTSTSGLILLMATTAFFSETIYGVFYFLDYYVYYDKVFDNSMFQYLDSFVLILMLVSSFTHCFTCFLMSSQYRQTAKNLFWRTTEKSRKTKDITITHVHSVAKNTSNN